MSDRVAAPYVGRRRTRALHAARPTVAVVGVYAALLAAAEVLAAFVAPVPAAGLDGVVLVALLSHYLFGAGAEAPDSGAPRADGAPRVFAALALVPLLRLSSLALSMQDPVALYVASGIPLLLAAVGAANALGLPGVLRLWEIGNRSQWHVALAAPVVAGLAAPLLSLEPVTHDRSVPALLLAGVVVFLFAGVLEEVVFRGLIQGALTPLLGRHSVPVANALFASTYLASGSAPYVLFMAAFGMACGWWVRRTGSVAGAAIGHGLLAAGLLVLGPALL